MRLIFPLIALACVLWSLPAPLALVLGVAVGFFGLNPYPDLTKRWAPRLLAWSVVGLGAGMDLFVVGRAGLHGMGYTLAGISLTFLLGWALSRALGVERNSATLITVGTAICGGSAIAAVAPAIRARPPEISVALGTVFLLNAAALLVFPGVGRWLGLAPDQFGLWAALAIHDTSSVVGAALQFGPESLHLATTVKLARALWILPVALAAAYLFREKGGDGAQKARKPWFILGFLLAAALVTFVPELRPSGLAVSELAKRLLVLTLFLIGANLSRANLAAVGVRPLVLGFSLWLCVSVASLGAILAGWVS